MKELFSRERLKKLFANYTNKDGLLLAQRRERTDLEFKKSFNFGSLSDYAKEMVAFANNQGGYIIFGVKNSPHVLKGLNQKSVKLFEQFEPKKVSRYFKNHFSHFVEFKHHLYDFNGDYFGIFYTFEAENKPIIATASDDCGGEALFSEGDILYRYDSESTQIRYPELEDIIDENVEREKESWRELFDQLSSISAASTASILDIKKKEIDGKKVIMDEKLPRQIKFIKKGEFKEKEGAPALQLGGEIKGIEAGIPTAEPDLENVFDLFLKGDTDHAEVYLRHLRHEYIYVPLWFFAQEVGREDAISMLESCSGGKPGVRRELIKRLRNPFCKLDHIRMGSIKYKGKVFDFIEENYGEVEHDSSLEDSVEDIHEDFFSFQDRIKKHIYSQAVKRNIILWLIMNRFDVLRNTSTSNWEKRETKFLGQALTNITEEDLELHEENILDALALLKGEYFDIEELQGLIRKAFASIDLHLYAPEQ